MDLAALGDRLGLRGQRQVISKAKEYQRLLSVRAGITPSSSSSSSSSTNNNAMRLTQETTAVCCLDLAAKLLVHLWIRIDIRQYINNLWEQISMVTTSLISVVCLCVYVCAPIFCLLHPVTRPP